MKNNRIESHQSDYKSKAWKTYTIQELGNWIHLFHKRSIHRDNSEKSKKDLYDAKNYLWMMEQKLKERAKELEIEYDTL